MPRAIWSGSITFGLVNIPVKVYTAVRDQTIRLHLLSPDGQCRLRQKLYCPETAKEYDFKETARGYEIAPQQYVIIEEKELQSIKPEAGRTIEITDFVDLEEIDPIHYDHTYYVGPDANGSKGYALLHTAMRRQNNVGIAKLIMREKEYLVALRARDQAIMMETMFFHDEVLDMADQIDLPSVRLSKKEVEMAERLVETLVAEFHPESYHDEYRDRLAELIERKAQGEKIVVEPAPRGRRTQTMNFMEALEASLKEAKRGGGAAARPTSRRPRKTA